MKKKDKVMMIVQWIQEIGRFTVRLLYVKEDHLVCSGRLLNGRRRLNEFSIIFFFSSSLIPFGNIENCDVFRTRARR